MKKKLLTAVVLVFIAFVTFLVMSDLNSTNETQIETSNYVAE